MAKHYIYPNPNPDGTNANQRIELHWQRDNGVQVASTTQLGSVDTAGALLDLNAARAAGNAHDIAKAQDAYSAILARATVDNWDGRFVDLTRDQINHLIKQLRIARDQAFGRDE